MSGDYRITYTKVGNTIKRTIHVNGNQLDEVTLNPIQALSLARLILDAALDEVQEKTPS